MTIINEHSLLELDPSNTRFVDARNVFMNAQKTEELINTELLKLAGEQMKKRKGKGVLPGKLYVNTIKQVLSKFNIPAEYKLQDKEECIEITVSIPKNK